jgi:hypothetical protein
MLVDGFWIFADHLWSNCCPCFLLQLEGEAHSWVRLLCLIYVLMKYYQSMRTHFHLEGSFLCCAFTVFQI